METVQKAGCILLDKQTKKIGLIYRAKYADYTFAKGHLEEGESLTDCALRETEEETGYIVQLLEIPALPVLEYTSRHQKRVQVHFFLAHALKKTQKEIPQELRHDPIWVDFNTVDDIILVKLIPYWRTIKPIVEKALF